MIYIILLFLGFIINVQLSTINSLISCQICFINSMCSDDTIDFNISISKHCQKPLFTHFTYRADISTKSYHYNTTMTCSDCYMTISIDPILGAWDYTLSLKSPSLLAHCPGEYTAHCNNNMSYVGWYAFGALAGVAIILGVLLCFIRQYHNSK